MVGGGSQYPTLPHRFVDEPSEMELLGKVKDGAFLMESPLLSMFLSFMVILSSSTLISFIRCGCLERYLYVDAISNEFFVNSISSSQIGTTTLHCRFNVALAPMYYGLTQPLACYYTLYVDTHWRTQNDVEHGIESWKYSTSPSECSISLAHDHLNTKITSQRLLRSALSDTSTTCMR